MRFFFLLLLSFFFVDHGIVSDPTQPPATMHSYATRVSPDHANRMVESSKKALKPFITNVFITTDIYKGPEAGL